MIFLTVLGLTVITLGARIDMAIAIEHPNDS